MDPLLAAASVAVPAAAGVFGHFAGQGDRDKAAAEQEANLRRFLNINIPDPEQQKIILERYYQTGTLDPAMEQAVQQQASEFGNIVVDPRGRDAELSALDKMQQLAAAGGMDNQAKAKIAMAQQAAASSAKGQRDAIAQRYAQQGTAGSGSQMAMELLAGQQNADQAAMLGMQAASDAEARALSALEGSAGIGSKLRAADYGQEADRAKATDTINNFNAANSQGVMTRNTGATNAAQAANLAAKQSVADKNVGVGNQQETYNKGLVQQQFENRMRQASGAAGASKGVSDAATANSDSLAKMGAGIGAAAGTGLGTAAQTKKKTYDANGKEIE